MGLVVWNVHNCVFVRLFTCAHVKERPQSSSSNTSQKRHYKASSWGLVWARPPSKTPTHRQTFTHEQVSMLPYAHVLHTPTHRQEDTTTTHGLQKINQIFLVIATKTSYLDVSRSFPGTPEWERWFQTVSQSTRTGLCLFFPLHDQLFFFFLFFPLKGESHLLYSSQCCRWLFAEERLKSLIHLPGRRSCHSA